jgi:hypothetical protein
MGASTISEQAKLGHHILVSPLYISLTFPFLPSMFLPGIELGERTVSSEPSNVCMTITTLMMDAHNGRSALLWDGVWRVIADGIGPMCLEANDHKAGEASVSRDTHGAHAYMHTPNESYIRINS